MKLKLRVESGPAVSTNEPDSLGPSSIAALKNFRFPPTQGRKQVGPRLAGLNRDELLSELIQRLPNSRHSFW